MTKIETLGFIGLGVMGEPMCANLLEKGGLPVYGFDLRQPVLDRLAAKGLQPCASVQEVAAEADLLFLSLPSGKEVEAVCFGPGSINEAPGRVKTIVDMSTSPVKLTRNISEGFAWHAIAYADAPVARTRAAAISGTLSIMVGGTPETFEAIRPFLDTMGSEVSHCGPVGSGQVVKILNNMLVFMNTEAVGEALAIGRRAGIEPELLLQTLSKGSGDSFVLRNHGMKAMLPGDFPEEAFSTDYALKDIGYALDLATDTGIDARGAKLARQVLTEASEAGFGRNYHPVMLKVIDKNG